METENWISAILNSTEGITKVTPDDGLFFKIQAEINRKKHISSEWIWIAAASFAILITINIAVIYNKSSQEVSSTTLLAASISKTNQLY
ncbi:MAG: hypothetical protein RL494_728 [Bacteroidota bacterium]|jgi:hypothetical protein